MDNWRCRLKAHWIFNFCVCVCVCVCEREKEQLIWWFVSGNNWLQEVCHHPERGYLSHYAWHYTKPTFTDKGKKIPPPVNSLPYFISNLTSSVDSCRVLNGVVVYEIPSVPFLQVLKFLITWTLHPIPESCPDDAAFSRVSCCIWEWNRIGQMGQSVAGNLISSSKSGLV